MNKLPVKIKFNKNKCIVKTIKLKETVKTNYRKLLLIILIFQIKLKFFLEKNILKLNIIYPNIMEKVLILVLILQQMHKILILLKLMKINLLF